MEPHIRLALEIGKVAGSGQLPPTTNDLLMRIAVQLRGDGQAAAALLALNFIVEETSERHYRAKQQLKTIAGQLATLARSQMPNLSGEAVA